VASRGRHHDFVGMVLAPRGELAVFDERGFDQLIEDVVDGVPMKRV
jgi:hypothetical protein